MNQVTMADLSGSTQFRSIKCTLPSGLMGGVYFETTGGTPALLNNYAYSQLVLSFTGVWAAAQNINISVKRVGNTVTLIRWIQSGCKCNRSNFNSSWSVTF